MNNKFTKKLTFIFRGKSEAFNIKLVLLRTFCFLLVFFTCFVVSLLSYFYYEGKKEEKLMDYFSQKYPHQFSYSMDSILPEYLANKLRDNTTDWFYEKTLIFHLRTNHILLKQKYKKVTDIEQMNSFRYASFIQLLECELKDISPLNGLSLTTLQIVNSPISDISSLKGMPLQTLFLDNTQVDDISPLKEMPLEGLYLGSTLVSDLTPLKGMITLKYLVLENCKEVKDLKPLLECPNLESLIIPDNMKNIDYLQSHPNLKYIDTKCMKEPVPMDWEMKSAEEFWIEYKKNKKIE